MKGAAGLRPSRILAVDDSATFRHALEERLTDEGYDVVTACSGEEALAYLEYHEVDAVLLDLVMPGLSGEETCRRIRAVPERCDVPIVALTSLDGTELIVEALRAGADDFVTKCDDFTLLDARLGAQLRRRRFEEEARHMREELLAAEMRASKAEADRALAETRARLLDDLEAKNRELEAAKERAEASVRARDEFLSIASHELRTPVTALWFQIERLQRALGDPGGALRPRLDGSAAGMARQVRRLAALIEALLDASRIGAGRFSLNVERFDLAAAVRAVVEDLGEAAERAGSPITLHAEAPLSGAWDRLRIEQMTLNLVHNAIKYGDGKPIDVTLERDGASVRLSVQDRGIGIADDQRERVFSIFERAVSPRNYGGLGLGLYIARHIAEAHGGSIGVTSRPGAGSTFVVDLPSRE